jgi:hypothetical protein
MAIGDKMAATVATIAKEGATIERDERDTELCVMKKGD